MSRQAVDPVPTHVLSLLFLILLCVFSHSSVFQPQLPCASGVWGSFRVTVSGFPPDSSQNVFFPQAEAGRDTLRLPVSLGVGEVTSGTLGRVWAGVCEGGSSTL